MSVPFLRDELGSSASLRVLVQDSATPTYLDITDKVRSKKGFETFFGRQNEGESTKPAKCSFTVDNSTGIFSPGEFSSIAPYNRIGSYVHVEVTLNGSTWWQLFIGEVAGIQPVWNLDGTVQEAEIECAGTLRRLNGITPKQSLARRFFSNIHPTDVVGYWPMEEEKGADNFEVADWHYSALPVTMGILSGEPKFASNSDFVSSEPICVLNGAQMEANLSGNYSTFGKYQLSFFVSVPESGSDNTIPLAMMIPGSDSSLGVIEVNYNSSSSVEIRGRNKTGGTVYAQSAGIALPGKPGMLTVQLVQVTGTTVSVNVFFNQVDGTTGGVTLSTMTSTILGTVRQLRIGSPTYHKSVAIGHVILRLATLNTSADFLNGVTGFSGESTSARFQRTCAESGISYGSSGTVTWFMGPQRPISVLDNVRETETLQRGIVYDGTTSGLYMRGSDAFENQAASITLDATGGELAVPFEVLNDDYGRCNVAEAKDINGSTVTVNQTQGNLKPSDVGEYQSTRSINRSPGSTLRSQDFAGWMLSHGTVEGYRYPSVTVDLRRNPSLAADVLALRPGARVDVENVHLVLPGHPLDTLRLTVQGVQHSVGPERWLVTLYTTPFEPNDIFVVAAESGDTGEFLGRVETEGSTLSAGASAGATSLSVATPGSILWTTRADDFPLTVYVGGVPVTVTNVSGTSSPQTFTVSATPVAFTSGMSVTVFRAKHLRV